MKWPKNFDRPVSEQAGQKWINHVTTPFEVVSLNGGAVTIMDTRETYSGIAWIELVAVKYLGRIYGRCRPLTSCA
jgi:hypothetical protein